jgi:hypothetical protein
VGWVRLDDRITEHPKVAAAGPLGLAVFVAAIAYSNRNLTDGFIPRSVAATLIGGEWTDWEGTIWRAAAHSGFQGEDFDCLEIAEHLVDVGLFHKPESNAVSNAGSHTLRERDGYVIHDYEDYQPSRKEVLAQREKNAERQFKLREKREKGRISRQKRNAVTNAGSNTVSNGPVTSAPTPTPTKEEAKASSTRNPVWDALTEVFGEASTESAKTLRGKVTRSLSAAGATGDEVRKRARSWPRHFEGATLTETALEKHWDALGRPPLRAGAR